MKDGYAEVRYADLGALGRIEYTMRQRGGGFDLTVICGERSFTAPDAVREESAARELLARLANGGVFPENVPEVLDDLLGVEF